MTANLTIGEYLLDGELCVYSRSIIDVLGRVGVSEHATRSTVTAMALTAQRKGPGPTTHRTTPSVATTIAAASPRSGPIPTSRRCTSATR